MMFSNRRFDRQATFFIGSNPTGRPVIPPLKMLALGLYLQRWQFGASEDDGGVAVANGGWHGREP